jgi:hypothetical protein
MSKKRRRERSQEEDPKFGREGCPFCGCDANPPPLPGELVYGFCALSGAVHVAVHGYDETLKVACDGHRVLLKDGFAITTAQLKNPSLTAEQAREVADEQADIEIRLQRPLSRKHSGESSAQLENGIIDRFMKFAMNDLRASGFNPVGIAGGVVFTEETASRCNAFWLLEEGITVNGTPVNPAKFVHDVGELLLKKDEK